MCIICNVVTDDDPHGRLDTANEFLASFERAQKAMKDAADAMLKVSKLPPYPEIRKRYDMMHKEMVRQCREWNKLEQKREHTP
jgi:hypothetical protein